MKNFIVCIFGLILVLGASAQSSYQVFSGTTSSNQYPAANGVFTATLTISPAFTSLGQAQNGCYSPYFSIGGPLQYSGTAVMHVSGPGFSVTENGPVVYGNCGDEVSIRFPDNSFYDLACWPQHPFTGNNNGAPVVPMIGPSYCYAKGGIQTPAFGYVSLNVNVNSSSLPKVLGDPTGQCPCAGVGEPIQVATGNLFEKAVDYTTVGNNPLAFKRFYNSQADPTAAASSLGTRWRSSFDRYIRILSSGTNVIAERADGQEFYFSPQKSGWASDSDVDVTLANSGSTWTLTDHDDTVETYTAISATEARLSTSQNRNGYTQTLTYNSSNQLLSVADSYGRSLTFSYSGPLLHTVTTPDGLVLTYGFTSSGITAGTLDRLTSVTYGVYPRTTQTYLYENGYFPLALTGIVDENGSRYATWTFDSSERAVTSYLGQGAEKTTISYDDVSGNRTVTNAAGQQSVYKFTQVEGVPRITEIDRLATPTTAAAKRTFSYDATGYLASQTDWNSTLSTYVNNAHGQPTTIVEGAGSPVQRTTTITYDSVWAHLPAIVITPGLTTSSAYDGSGNPLTRTLTDTTAGTVPYSTNGQSRTWTFTWGNYGLLVTAKGPRTDVDTTMRYAYVSGALSKVTNALGQSIQVTVNTPGGRPQIIVDANGVTTYLDYDGRQRLTSRSVVTTAASLTTSFRIDPAGNQVQVTLPDGSFLSNSFDAAHRLTKITNALGDYIQFTLDALGDRTHTAIYAKNGTLSWQSTSTPDALGRELTRVTGTGKNPLKVSSTYDSNGNAITVQDGLGNTVTYNYDALSRPSTSTDANKGATKLSFDANDLPVTVQDANGNATIYTRNGFGEVIQQASPDSGVAVLHYDLASNLIAKTDALGIVMNRTFDALSRPLTTTFPAHPAENVAYVYDQTGTGFTFGVGRLTSLTDAAGSLTKTYDEQSNLLSEKRVNGSTTLITAYTYDRAGRKTGMAYPDGTLVYYLRDAAGQIIGVSAKPVGVADGITLGVFTHQAFGPINGATFGNGTAETWGFDDAGRPLTLVDTLSGKSLQSLAYSYDAANNVTAVTDAVNSANSQTFGYDSVNRLVSSLSGAGGYGTLAWQYDPVGNRIQQLLNGQRTTYHYTPGTNRLATISPATASAASHPQTLVKQGDGTAGALTSIIRTPSLHTTMPARPPTATYPAGATSTVEAEPAAIHSASEIGPPAISPRRPTQSQLIPLLTPAAYIIPRYRNTPMIKESAWSGYSERTALMRLNALLTTYLPAPLLPPSGTFYSPITISIPPIYGADIFYTTNGATPTTASTLYTGPFVLNTTTMVRAISTLALEQGVVIATPNSNASSAIYTIVPATALPQFSIAGGTFTKAQTLSLTDTTPGAAVYFTTDGSTPSTSSTRYASPITVGTTATIQAIALASGYGISGVARATYTISLPPTASPQFSVTGGTFTKVQTVALTDATQGALIYFTTDGSTPNTSSMRYTAPLSVSSTETIQAIAIANGYSTSSVASAVYTINLAVTATPSISTLNGNGALASPPVEFSLSDSTPGAAIYYTIDNTTPTVNSSLYTAPVFVNLLGGLTVKAIAAAAGYQNSPVTAHLYDILTAPSPLFSPVAGTVSAGQTVTLSVPPVASVSNPTVPVAITIYYTTDGSTPSVRSTRYTEPIPITGAETISAIAMAGGLGSAVVASHYSIGSSSDMTVTTNAAGNITGIPSADGLYYLTFSYNNAGRQSMVSGGPLAATFIYDWAGQRYSKTNGGIPATVYSYGQSGEIIAENDGGAVTDYIYVDGRPIAQLRPNASIGSQLSFVVADRLGTPQRLVSSNGGTTLWSTTYQPFGTTSTVSGSINQNLRFPGQFADTETEVSYNLNRDYMPNLGRFLESDPTGLSGGTNTYQYVAGNPVARTDPSGEDFRKLPTIACLLFNLCAMEPADSFNPQSPEVWSPQQFQQVGPPPRSCPEYPITTEFQIELPPSPVMPVVEKAPTLLDIPFLPPWVGVLAIPFAFFTAYFWNISSPL